MPSINGYMIIISLTLFQKMIEREQVKLLVEYVCGNIPLFKIPICVVFWNKCGCGRIIPGWEINGPFPGICTGDGWNSTDVMYRQWWADITKSECYAYLMLYKIRVSKIIFFYKLNLVLIVTILWTTLWHLTSILSSRQDVCTNEKSSCAGYITPSQQPTSAAV